MLPALWLCHDLDAQRSQFGRLLRRGLAADQAKALMPRCQVCITATLGRKRRHRPPNPTPPGAGNPRPQPHTEGET